MTMIRKEIVLLENIHHYNYSKTHLGTLKDHHFKPYNIIGKLMLTLSNQQLCHADELEARLCY